MMLGVFSVVILYCSDCVPITSRVYFAAVHSCFLLGGSVWPGIVIPFLLGQSPGSIIFLTVMVWFSVIVCSIWLSFDSNCWCMLFAVGSCFHLGFGLGLIFGLGMVFDIACLPMLVLIRLLVMSHFSSPVMLWLCSIPVGSPGGWKFLNAYISSSRLWGVWLISDVMKLSISVFNCVLFVNMVCRSCFIGLPPSSSRSLQPAVNIIVGASCMSFMI